MARTVARYVCQDCGASYGKWTGRCDACGAWNTIVEEAPRAAPPLGTKAGGRLKGRRIPFVGLKGAPADARRMVSGIGEFDRVCGGGLVPGSAVLIGGDPGIGKSTLVLQVLAALSAGHRCVYVSGEEAVDQVRMRAARMGLAETGVEIAAATNLGDIVASVDVADHPDAIVVDSIQTMYVDLLDSAPGTVAQVRASAQELIRVAKHRGLAALLVGHVTKEGQIAGPRVLEHMVDTVLYFEGERSHQFRILRAVKNRFGPANEIGVFEMTDRGLVEVSNPSALFLSESRESASGAAVFAGMEGSRPVLVEIQALVAPTSFATPRRAVVGWDSARLAMVLAVIEARCGVPLGGRDVYLNVAGGLRIGEPAADLAVAGALLSSLFDRAVPPETVLFGEIGLSGEVRPVGQAPLRLREAGKLGFTRAIVPPRSGGDRSAPEGMEITEIGHLGELVHLFEAAPSRGTRAVGEKSAAR